LQFALLSTNVLTRPLTEAHEMIKYVAVGSQTMARVINVDSVTRLSLSSGKKLMWKGNLIN